MALRLANSGSTAARGMEIGRAGIAMKRSPANRSIGARTKSCGAKVVLGSGRLLAKLSAGRASIWTGGAEPRGQRGGRGASGFSLGWGVVATESCRSWR